LINTSAAFNNVSVGGLLLSNVSGANASSTFETVKDLAATGLISKETFLDQYYIIYFSDSQGLDSSRYLWKYLWGQISHHLL
jgi:hypothetical protein